MSHNILALDSAIRAVGTAQSWHNKESVASGPVLHARDISDIAYPVIKRERVLADGQVFAGNNCRFDIIGMHPKHEIILASASSEYEVLGNDELLNRTFDAFNAHGIPANFSYGLTMGNGKHVSYAFEIEGHKEFFAHQSDLHKIFINVAGSHDKTLGIKIFGSATRVVCANTLKYAMRGQKHLLNYTFFHSKTGIEDFRNLPDIIEGSLSHAAAYSRLAEQLGNRAITMHQAKAIALQLLASGKDEVSTQLVNNAVSISRLFGKEGKGNNGENMYDFLNGVTEFYTTGDGSGKTVPAFQKAVSADHGNAADKKVYVLNALQNDNGEIISDAEIDAMIKQGEILLMSYETKQANKQLAKA